MKKILLAWVILLALLHHDFWWWNDPSLVAGGVPVGLAWHVLYSLVTAITCYVATRIAWPSAWEAWAAEPENQEAPLE